MWSESQAGGPEAHSRLPVDFSAMFERDLTLKCNHIYKYKAWYLVVIWIWKTLSQTSKYWIANPTFGMQLFRACQRTRMYSCLFVPQCSWEPDTETISCQNHYVVVVVIAVAVAVVVVVVVVVESSIKKLCQTQSRQYKHTIDIQK